ncbi:unnamed protein product [Polarella glacialis]|uniref:Uncharacterized protein n=1 Tax=Polarella glacialis TaxID=89957 RepID=A0A813E5T5_POLGL|nr:unnamed protein product [Polarella glacialis]
MRPWLAKRRNCRLCSAQPRSSCKVYKSGRRSCHQRSAPLKSSRCTQLLNRQA